MFDFSVDVAEWGERNHEDSTALVLIIGGAISVANECHSFLADCSFAVDRAYNLRDEEEEEEARRRQRGRREVEGVVEKEDGEVEERTR